MRQVMPWIDRRALQMAELEWSRRPRTNRLWLAMVLTLEMAVVTVLAGWGFSRLFRDAAAWSCAGIVFVWFAMFIWNVAVEPVRGFKIGLVTAPLVALAPLVLAFALTR